MEAPGGNPNGRPDSLSLSQLEEQVRESQRTVYRWFRFRVRRGLGMLYLLFSFLPVFGTLIFAISGSLAITIICGTIVGVGSSIVFRAAGLRGFGRMSRTIDMLKGRSTLTSLNGRAALLIGFALWPWAAYGVAISVGLTSLAAAFAVIWLVELGLYMAFKRLKDPLFDRKAEDWIAMISFPIGAVLSTLPGLPGPLNSYGFLLISPLLLFAGAKSLYDAPRELVVNLDSEQG
jgi:hypothetical protein